ncbi:hypothetical protein HDU97_008176 [Phlyctochytrium planicorne]|nr:hypothetical protein HDU97_008176 [Phlyctochytrium planicorne]
MTMRNIHIAITSDVVCPWCFIGKRRLEIAIRMAKEKGLPLNFTFEYLPFQLDPTMAKEGVNKQERLEKKFGKEAMARMMPYMQKVGEDNGIKFSYGGLIGNTFDAHRLIAFAKTKERQYELVEELFSDYFEKERNIADRAVLADAAERAGISKDEAVRFLNSKEGEAEVNKGVAQNRLDGITGVPYYVIDNKYEVSGAQEPESFLQIFQKLANQASI